jgi:hypothetical protein
MNPPQPRAATARPNEQIIQKFSATKHRLSLKCDGTREETNFVFRRDGRVHLNRRGASVQSTTGSRGVCISGSNAGYIMFRGSMKSIEYLLYPPVSSSLPLPCVNVCHHISTGPYFKMATLKVLPLLHKDQLS